MWQSSSLDDDFYGRKEGDSLWQLVM
jgi:hypothetical protein